MGEMNGIEATRRILRTSPHIAILVLTMFEDDDFVFSALRAGARGYLLKGTMKADLLRRFAHGHRGGHLWCGHCTPYDDLSPRFSTGQRLDALRGVP